MVSRRLVTFVHVDGVQYGPDSDVSDDIAAQITNESVWADESHKDEQLKPAKKAAPKRPSN